MVAGFGDMGRDEEARDERARPPSLPSEGYPLSADHLARRADTVRASYNNTSGCDCVKSLRLCLAGAGDVGRDEAAHGSH